MQSQLVIGQKHLNDKGRVDAVSILPALATYQSSYLREVHGFTFEQLENQFSVKFHVQGVNVRQGGAVGLNDVCTVSTEMIINSSTLTFKQSVVAFGNTEILTSLQVLSLTGDNHSDLPKAFEALRECQKVEA